MPLAEPQSIKIQRLCQVSKKTSSAVCCLVDSTDDQNNDREEYIFWQKAIREPLKYMQPLKCSTLSWQCPS